MTDAWAPPPEPGSEADAGYAPPGGSAAVGRDGGSRLGCALAFLAFFLVGFAGVGAVLFLRAPDGPRPPAEPPLAHLLRAPEGYQQLPDSTSGGGRVTERGAATLLGRTGVPGFRDGVLRAWGRPPGEPPRAVVVLLLDLDSPEAARRLAGEYAAALRTRGAEPFPTPTALDADGLREPADASGRHAQRVVLARGSRLYVVSVVTPAADADTSEVVALAARQAAAA